MAHSSPYRVVFCTCPDPESAEALARRLVEAGQAACVNIVPGLRSIYRWQGRLESETEQLLIIKTRAEAYPKLEKTIRDHHPYQVPEVLSVPVDAGLAAYFAWLDSALSNH